MAANRRRRHRWIKRRQRTDVAGEAPAAKRRLAVMAAGGVKADVMRYLSAKPVMLTKRGEAPARRSGCDDLSAC
jgi:hypothetical protein